MVGMIRIPHWLVVLALLVLFALGSSTAALAQRGNAPINDTPVAPANETPVMPVVETPVAPVFETPVVPVFETVVASVDETPIVPVYETPTAETPAVEASDVAKVAVAAAEERGDVAAAVLDEVAFTESAALARAQAEAFVLPAPSIDQLEDARARGFHNY